MTRIFLFCFFCLVSASVNGQESELVVRYDFTKASSPPSKVFYLKVFVDSVFADSTKPHSPHHNLANSVRTKITTGPHNIRLEGCVKEENEGLWFVKNVMNWNGNFNVKKEKCKISIKMNSDYVVEVCTTTDL